MPSEEARTGLGLIPALFTPFGAGGVFSEHQAWMSVPGCVHTQGHTHMQQHPCMHRHVHTGRDVHGCRNTRVQEAPAWGQLPSIRAPPHFCTPSNLGIFSVLHKQQKITHSHAPPPPGAQLVVVHTRQRPRTAKLSVPQADLHAQPVTFKDLGDAGKDDSPNASHTLLVTFAAARADGKQLFGPGCQRRLSLLAISSTTLPVNLNLSTVSGKTT